MTARPILAIALAADDDDAPWIAAFRPQLPDMEVLPLGDVADPARIRYVAAWRHPHGCLAPLGGAAAIFSLGAGVDHLLADPALPPGVPIARVVDPDLTGRMSEWVVLHVLLHHRQQRRYAAQQRERRWRDDAAQPAARHVRVGIMGLGEMGRDAVQKLGGLGFAMAGWSRTPQNLPGCATYAGEAGLEAFLAHAQILVVLLPLTPQTRGVLARPLFERLARDGHAGAPILINAGRGGLQNETDILACLADGTLHAATLDVFEEEPLPQTSPLWHHPAVTITPHNAAVSNPDAVAGFIATQIRAHQAGRPLAHRVDPARGY